MGRAVVVCQWCLWHGGDEGRIWTVPRWHRSAAFMRQNCGQQEGPGSRESMALCGVLPPKGSAPVREISLPHWWYFQDAPGDEGIKQFTCQIRHATSFHSMARGLKEVRR